MSDGFMRPMRHCPEAAALHHPQQSLLEELGLSCTDLDKDTSSSGSEDEAAASTARVHLPPPPSHTEELKELQHMLKETQRRLHKAQGSLAESEQTQERRLKIMRKTHQSALALKQALIQELQDVVAEQQEALLGDIGPVENEPGVVRLMEHIALLHRELTSAQSQLEDVREEVCCLRKECNQAKYERALKNTPILRSPMKPVNSALAQQVCELQKRVLGMEREREGALQHITTGRKLQSEVEELQSQLRAALAEKSDLQKQNEKLQCQNSCLSHELDEAKAAIVRLKSSLKVEQSRSLEVEKKHEQQQRLLMEEKAEVESQLNTLSSEMKELQKAQRTVVEDNQLLREQLNVQSCQLEQRGLTLAASQKEVKLESLQEAHLRLHSQLSQQQSAIMEAEERGRKEASSALRSHQTSLLLHSVHESVKSLQSSITDTSLHWNTAISELGDGFSAAARKLCALVAARHCSLLARYRKEMALRRRLHNKLVELRGNIRVLCRVRPPITEDGETDEVVRCDEWDVGVVEVCRGGEWKHFELDRVFGPLSSQEEVYAEVQPLVVSCMDGYNVCIFAYGQTGSGKTYTMEGPPGHPGLNQRALLELFALVAERKGEWHYSILVSVMEIYNEMVRDLLSVDHLQRMEVKQGPAGIFVPGLSQVQVSSPEEVKEVFALGHQNRSTGATRMNIESSRSHALLCVTVLGENCSTGMRTVGRLNLIDLAGSERVSKSGSTGERLQEAKHINRSLSALGDVIHALRSHSPHVPYRNSKLTFLLQDSLSGDSKTLMLVQVSPVQRNSGETICSLNFAQRVRAVELGPAVRNTEHEPGRPAR